MKNKEFCPNCLKETEYHEKPIFDTVEVHGVKVGISLMHCFCDECGQEVDVASVTDQNLKACYEAYKKQENLLSGEEVKGLRDKYSLSASNFALLLGFGEKTVTRYENGAIQDRAYDILMRLCQEPSNMIALLNFNGDKLDPEVLEQTKLLANSLLHEKVDPTVYLRMRLASFSNPKSKKAASCFVASDAEKLEEGDNTASWGRTTPTHVSSRLLKGAF